MSRRQRCARDKVAHSRIARAKALRRRARLGAKRSAATAIAAAATVAGLAASPATATPESGRASAAGHAAAPLVCSNPHDLASNPNDMTDVGGTLFFVADDGVHGEELWKTDGTTAGTVLVKDINPAGAAAGTSTARPT